MRLILSQDELNGQPSPIRRSTAMAYSVERSVAARTQLRGGSLAERKAADDGLVAPYLLEIDRELTEAIA